MIAMRVNVPHILIYALGLLAGLIALQALIVWIRGIGAGKGSIRRDVINVTSVLQMIRDGRRVQAVRAIREATGVSLAQAVEIMEQASRGDVSLLEQYLED